MKSPYIAGICFVLVSSAHADLQVGWTTQGYKISDHLNSGGAISGGVAQMIYSKNGTADSGLISGSFANWNAAESWVSNSSDEIILATFTFTSTIKNIGWDGYLPAGSDAQFSSSNPNVTIDGTYDKVLAWAGQNSPGLTASSILYVRVIEEVGNSGYSAYGGIQYATEFYNVAPPTQVIPNVTITGNDGQGNSNGWVTTATGIRGPGGTSGKGWSSFTVVPEPATFGLFAVAAAGLAFRRRKLL